MNKFIFVVIFFVLSNCLVAKNSHKDRPKDRASSSIPRSSYYKGLNVDDFIKKWSRPPPEWISEHIDAELAFFKKKPISLQALNATFNKIRSYTETLPYTTCVRDCVWRYRIVNNKIYRYGRSEDSMDLILRTLGCLASHRQVPNLPNIDVLMNLIDGMPMPWDPENFWIAQNPMDQAPILCAWKPRNDPFILTIPQRGAIASWKDLSAHIIQSSEKNPWESKDDVVVWRGNNSDLWVPAYAESVEALIEASIRCPRYTICYLSSLYPNLIDAGYTLGGIPSQPLLDFLAPLTKNLLTQGEHLHFKYLAAIDGLGFAGSGGAGFEWRLLSNSVVFKQESPRVTWFESALKPYVHYIPVKQDLSDLFDQIRWAKSHDGICRRIAKIATQFALDSLTAEDMYYYFLYLFLEYAKCQSFDTQELADDLANDPSWVRIW